MTKVNGEIPGPKTIVFTHSHWYFQIESLGQPKDEFKNVIEKKKIGSYFLVQSVSCLDRSFNFNWVFGRSRLRRSTINPIRVLYVRVSSVYHRDFYFWNVNNSIRFVLYTISTSYPIIPVTPEGGTPKEEMPRVGSGKLN